MAFKTGVAERDEWSYAPGVGVGPLRFGMTVDEVIKSAQILGQTKISGCALDHAILSPTSKVEVHRRGVAPSAPAITTYGSQAAGQFCIAADAVHGPQAAYDGLPPVAHINARRRVP
ncbi:hypothetical protein [Streptomyces sp. NPDC005262]|uniref:hypothetical protein n=1 Tax=Streptomyces sp. NPDC005262 TaxID=3364710 RepID=UPI0036A0BF8E